MKLTHALLEKRIKRRIKAELRNDKALAAEARRLTPSIWSHNFLETGFGRYFPLFIMASLSAMILLKSGAGVRIFAFNLLLASMTAFLCRSLLVKLKASDELFILLHYPLRDKLYFSRQWQTCLRNSLVILFASLVYFSAGILLSPRSRLEDLWWAAAFSGLNWLEAVMIVLLLAYFFRNAPYLRIGAIGVLLTIACVISSNYQKGIFLDTPWLIWLPPAGINSMLYFYGVGGNMLHLKLLSFLGLLSLPVIMVVYVKYRASYRSEDIYELAFSDDDDDEQSKAPVATNGDLAAEPIDFNHALGMKEEAMGWVERTVVRFLSPKEQEQVKCLYGDVGCNWSNAWKYGLAIMLIGLATMMIHSKVAVAGSIIVLLGIASMTPVFGGSWQFCRSFYWQPGFYQINLAYPIDYWPASKLMLKVNWVRIVLAIPVALTVGTFVVWWLKREGMPGIVLAALLMLMMAALQPILVSMKFGAFTHDTEITLSALRKTFLSSTTLLSEAVCIIIAVVLSCWGASEGKCALALTGVALVAFISFMSWLINGLFYDRSRVEFGASRTGQ